MSMADWLKVLFVLLLLTSTAVATEDLPGQINGRVLDETGRPILGASVSALWGANGLIWKEVVAVRSTEPEAPKPET
jgi:hypothetical protein